jgi:hypothetical protein
MLLLDGGGVVCLDDHVGCRWISRLLRLLSRTRIPTLDARDVGVLIRGVGRGDLIRLLCVCMLVDLFFVGRYVVKADWCRLCGY